MSYEADELKTYIIDVEIKVGIGNDLSIRINGMSLVLVCHQNCPARQLPSKEIRGHTRL